jgi:uncharacterized protein YodC (DUF2158 family)
LRQQRTEKPAVDAATNGEDRGGFAPGDQVRVGDGPVMTVSAWSEGRPTSVGFPPELTTHEPIGWCCIWFNQRAVRTHVFNPAVLRRAAAKADA